MARPTPRTRKGARSTGTAVRKRRAAAPPAGPVRSRVALVILGLIGAFGVVAAELVKLQVIDAADLAARARDQQTLTVHLSGERGTITDRNGVILAKNMDVPSLFADPAAVPDPAAAARALARVLPASTHTILHRMRDGSRHFAWLQRKADPALAGRVMALDLAGVHELPESGRFYPKGQLLGQILGFAGMDNVGLSGVEQAFDGMLKGGEVVYLVERDGLGRRLVPAGGDVRPTRGADLVVTIDEVVQYHVERALDRVMEKSGARSAEALVMDPDTGEILAMAVRPGFDPNRIGSYAPEDLRNRLITDPYEPGSTMKMVLAAVALDAGVVSLDEVIDCERGTLPLRGGALHDHEPMGEIPFSQVLVRSSNIGAAKVAMRLGADRLHDALVNFGFGQRTGIELPGESPGVLMPVSRWSGRSLPSVAIGQEIMVTPLQVVTAASAIANGGWLVRPHLVKEVRGPDGVKRTRPERRRRVVSAETAARLRETLVGVTGAEGTAPAAAVQGYRVAGKTGTAQKAAEGRRGYAPGKYIASFVGMVPASNPRIVAMVVVDQPVGLHYGGSVAGPVFRELAGPVLAYLGVPPETARTVRIARAGS